MLPKYAIMHYSLKETEQLIVITNLTVSHTKVKSSKQTQKAVLLQMYTQRLLTTVE